MAGLKDMRIHMYIYIYVDICIYIHTYMYIYIYMCVYSLCPHKSQRLFEASFLKAPFFGLTGRRQVTMKIRPQRSLRLRHAGPMICRLPVSRAVS